MEGKVAQRTADGKAARGEWELGRRGYRYMHVPYQHECSARISAAPSSLSRGGEVASGLYPVPHS